MREKIKTGISITIILLLFPYVAVMLLGRAEGQERAGTEQSGNELEALVWEALPGQMSPACEPEALKALAVLVRSSLVFHMEKDGTRPEELEEEQLEEWGFPVYSPEELQSMWGQELFGEYYGKLSRAVQETAGLILTCGGQYIDPPYHAVSAGRTRDGSLLGEEYAYIKSVDCPGELEAEGFLSVLQRNIPGELDILETDDAGYVLKLSRDGETLAGEEFRTEQALPSSCFTLQKNEGGWRITVRGQGHGFGLSMYQARRMAALGSSFSDILEYFYEETECISFS